jgi:hypothetical protein
MMMKDRDYVGVTSIVNRMSKINSRVSNRHVLDTLKRLLEKELLMRRPSSETYEFRIGLIGTFIDYHVTYAETAHRIGDLW